MRMAVNARSTRLDGCRGQWNVAMWVAKSLCTARCSRDCQRGREGWHKGASQRGPGPATRGGQASGGQDQEAVWAGPAGSMTGDDDWPDQQGRQGSMADHATLDSGPHPRG